MTYRIALIALVTCLATVLVGLSRPALADYLPFNGAEVAPNIAEIELTPTGVSVRFEIFFGDIPEFGALLPDTWLKDPSGRASEADRWAEFSNSGLSFRRPDGTPLPVEVVLLDRRQRVDRTNALSGQRNPITGEIYPGPPDDSRVIYAELFYSFEGQRPDILTVSPPSQPNGTPLVSIGMLVVDREVPVTAFRILSQSARLTIDWNDPWFSRFDSTFLRRHHQSGTTTFLYLEPREVRYETLIRVRDLAAWLDLDFTSGQTLSPNELAGIKVRAADLLADRNAVTIDGAIRQPEAVKAEILRIDPVGLQIVEGSSSVNVDAAFVGTIFSFPVPGLPDRVAIDWNMFDERITDVPATLTDPAGPFMSGARPESPLVEWTNHLNAFENPSVMPVRAEIRGSLSVPVLSGLALVVSLAALVVGLSSVARSRHAAFGVSALFLVAALGTMKGPTVEVPNPVAKTPDNAEASAIFAGILGNVNIANLEPQPDLRKSRMMPVISDASLDDVAAELERALAIRVPSGGLARVTEVNDLTLSDIRPAAAGFGFEALAEWSATASAAHWGHTHTRNVTYRALIDVAEEQNAWKLHGITVIETRFPDA